MLNRFQETLPRNSTGSRCWVTFGRSFFNRVCRVDSLAGKYLCLVAGATFCSCRFGQLGQVGDIGVFFCNPFIKARGTGVFAKCCTCEYVEGISGKVRPGSLKRLFLFVSSASLRRLLSTDLFKLRLLSLRVCRILQPKQCQFSMPVGPVRQCLIRRPCSEKQNMHSGLSAPQSPNAHAHVNCAHASHFCPVDPRTESAVAVRC